MCKLKTGSPVRLISLCDDGNNNQTPIFIDEGRETTHKMRSSRIDVRKNIQENKVLYIIS